MDERTRREPDAEVAPAPKRTPPAPATTSPRAGRRRAAAEGAERPAPRPRRRRAAASAKPTSEAEGEQGASSGGAEAARAELGPGAAEAGTSDLRTADLGTSDPGTSDPGPTLPRATKPRTRPRRRSAAGAESSVAPIAPVEVPAPPAPAVPTEAVTPEAVTPAVATEAVQPEAVTPEAVGAEAPVPRAALWATPRPVAGPTAPAVRVPAARIALSTSSVYPESVAAAFEIARRLGYDGVELMVFTDPVSQDPEAVRALSDYYGVPVLSVHSPCLLVTQRVWSTDPWVKLQRSQAVAERLGATTVVVHPPFRWQRDYGREFERGLARMRDETDVVFAVENMYPWRARTREWAAYTPDWDPRNQDYPQVTLDLSHTSVSGTPALDMAVDLGDRLTHLHLADGTGLARDEHLIPGRGTQPCAQILESLAGRGFDGTVVLEVSTRKAANRAEREAELAEALAFARLHLAAPLEVPSS